MMDWIFYNITGGEYILGRGGGATAQRSYCTPVSQADAQPGDLAFYPDDSHVGIVVGRREDGNLLICHCSIGQNNVVGSGRISFAKRQRDMVCRCLVE